MKISLSVDYFICVLENRLTADQSQNIDSTSDDDGDLESDTDLTDSKNAASILVPGFGALLASSAVLLFGIAL